MTDQLIELQTQLTFQEQTINELNDALTSQQQQLDQLARKVDLLNEQMMESVDLGNKEGENEPPPHY